MSGYVRQSIPFTVHAMPAPRKTYDSRSTRQAPRWVACRDFGSEIEASIAGVVLDGSGIPSLIRNNDTAGLFGAGHQGWSARGVTLMVPDAALSAARTVLALHDAETA